LIHLKKAVAAGIFAIALIATFSIPSQANPAADVAAVHAADDAWIKAYNAGEVANVVALYDEKSVIYAPGAPAVEGRAAIQAFFEKDIAAFAKTGLVMSLAANPDGGVSGNTGWSSGTWFAKDKDGKVADSGWYFSVSKKVGGKWLYVRDAWNSNGPATPAATTQN
jgi:ketosteroid isomerase-like protein